ncbi:hypothetical protein FBEOM_6134 [Fusarium beomiforme]|uniref:Uncharacterized protein n=1 Tax=Fusarium beomiforme TaxID=44412 RepID=A0A9P5DYA5_9HYPO|nr:hypothetical protein FBEOM_6134 [Fusarium beomiforme]
MVWYFNQDHRDSTENFLDDWAQPAGLRMPGDKQAPECFQVVPAAENSPSLVGLSNLGPIVSAQEYTPYPPEGVFISLDDLTYRTEPLQIPDVQQLFIKLDVDAKMLSLVSKIDYTMNTIWSLKTDPAGKSFICTAAFTQNTDASGNPAGITRTLWYLGTSDGNTQVICQKLPSTDQPDKRNAVLPHLQWTIDVVSQPVQHVPDVLINGLVTLAGNVLSAIVDISQNGTRLGRWATCKTLQLDPGVSLVKDENAITGNAMYPDKMFCVNLTVDLAPIGLSDFFYLRPHWTIHDTDTELTRRAIQDLRNLPRFQFPGTFSGDLQWPIDPPLPTDSFELITSPSVDEGVIKEIDGRTAPVIPATTYTVSCSMLYRGVVSETRTTQVIIEVIHDTGDI